MALLINIGQPEWMTDDTLREQLAPLLPNTTIYCGIPQTTLPDVTMIAVSESVPDIWQLLPNLALIQKLGAGVNFILQDPKLPPHIRVARLASKVQAREIAEYCLAHVLGRQHNFDHYRSDQSKQAWIPIAPGRADQTTVGILGLGNIGEAIAQLFVSFGFRVIGWSRSDKSITGVDCRSRQASLPALLSECDYVVSILPSTPQTCDLFDNDLFSHMKPGAILINVGRGDLIVESALIAALDQGSLGGAVLDVFLEEPLAPEHPFWHHPKITITPHVSGWHVDGGIRDIMDNYHRLSKGSQLLHEVNRNTGY